jgi:hypothetical protein
LVVALLEEGAGFVGSGSFPRKKFSILSRKFCSSTGEGGAAKAGGTGHGTGNGGGATRTVPQAVSKSSGTSVKIPDLIVFFLT